MMKEDEWTSVSVLLGVITGFALVTAAAVFATSNGGGSQVGGGGVFTPPLGNETGCSVLPSNEIDLSVSNSSQDAAPAWNKFQRV